MHFSLDAIHGTARAGTLTLSHGVVKTPVFMPIATVGAVKTLLASEVEALGAQILLGNTYHLHLRPGDSLIADLGGFHDFIGWEKPVLTDSGGFQVFSLSAIRKMSDDGVEFRSHLDGSRIFMRPEDSMQIQWNLGSDIAMVLDECVDSRCDETIARAAMERTHAWADRCQKWHAVNGNPQRQTLFAIVQGAIFPELRRQSAQTLRSLNFSGYAIGGLAVGETAPEMYEMLETVCPELPNEKPRYLMGVGTPENLLEAVSRGVDMFDCVMPTRNARHGSLFTVDGKLPIGAARFARDLFPIDPECACPVCRGGISRAYLRHLFSIGERLAERLATIHNLHFYLDLMKKTRESIEEKRFEVFKRDFLARYAQNIHFISL